jgi:hypothetical protein
LKERHKDMEESVNRPVEDTIWYENDQPIQEFLENFRKPAILKDNHPSEELSWVQLVEKSNQP